MTDTATRPPATLLDDPLPEELHPAPPAPPAPVEQTFELLPVSLIRPGPHNPRRDLGDLEGLAASMRAVGILEPLIVEKYSGPLAQEPYTLLAGHRRLAAAKLAGLVDVPCLIRATEASPALRMEMAIVENLQREGLAPLDEADGYRELVKLGLPQRAIAERVGCSQSHVSKRLGLLALPTHVQKRVEKGTMPLEAAAALTRLKDHPDKLKAAAGEDPSAIVRAVERAEQEIAWEAKVAELREVAKGKGWKVVDEPQDRWSKRSFKTLAKWGYDDRELERARRWWVRSSQSFGQMAKSGTGWSTSIQRGSNNARSVWNRLDRFAACALRLGCVAIENRDALEVIERYDDPRGAMYIDPPYLGSTRSATRDGRRRGDYAHEFLSDAQHEALAAVLGAVQAAVLVSGYPSDLYEKLYAGWWRIERQVLCRVSNGRSRTNGLRTEVIWSNRPLDEGQLAVSP